MLTSRQTLDMLRPAFAGLFDPARIVPRAHPAQGLDIDRIDAVDLIAPVRRVIGRKAMPEDFRSVRSAGNLAQAIEWPARD
jgi:acyl carrier protein